MLDHPNIGQCLSTLMPMTDILENATSNQYQNNGTGFWSVCHTIWYLIFLLPVYNMFYFVTSSIINSEL